MSKIFDTSDFGYREIKVERPLRLNYLASPERIDRLRRENAFLKLGHEEQGDIINVLTNWITSTPYQDANKFEKALVKAFNGAGLAIGTPLKNAILSALSKRDENAAPRRAANGRTEADPELRDYEMVPLTEDWRVFVEREVTPFAADAWVDETYKDANDDQVGRVGYEISFNRYFHSHRELPPLNEIKAELASLESDIAALLQATGA